ncbi:NAD(P)H-binding protein [Actinomadura kijaniata]|uniref:NAD(P)H-binding protein n=1 Tax=Actinomadura kijaniata TaxID=46161 RepID=UPI000831C40A|nr:NAD(P)H-binding protein [Actinomadura kijaniata]
MILVTGASGNVGRPLVDLLLRDGVPVRALTRDPAAAGLPAGADVVAGDLTTIGAALPGVEAVFLVWPMPTADAAPAVVEAVAAHARRVVLLSSAAVLDGVGTDDNVIGRLHADLEAPIAASGLEWTFLRPWGFATNTLAWAEEIRAHGTVSDIHGQVAASLIHERDIAAVAARALTEDGHAGAAYELTGPELLTQVEQARIIGEAIGRPVRWREISRAEAHTRKVAAGFPPEFADVMLDGFAALAERPGRVTSTVEEVTGVPARSFRQWAADHAADFR